jgi:glucose-6-phosphate 1-dehydrogenase
VDAREKAPQAGALVIFGITGDLAKKQTFRALYRLEARNRMAKKVIAVARQDWSKEQLIERARQSIEDTGEKIDEAVFKRLAGRMSYLSGDFSDEGLYKRLAKELSGVEHPLFYLEIPPNLFLRWSRNWARPGSPRVPRWRWRSRSGMTWPRRASSTPT